jgi:hypothetical protein
VSRASLIDVYIAALPFTPVAVVAIPAGGCRVAVGGEIAPGEKTKHRLYFKANHVELVLSAAGLTDAPIPQPPDAVAGKLQLAAKSVGAPFQTLDALQADAEIEVDKIIARVEATNQAGG